MNNNLEFAVSPKSLGQNDEHLSVCDRCERERVHNLYDCWEREVIIHGFLLGFKQPTAVKGESCVGDWLLGPSQMALKMSSPCAHSCIRYLIWHAKVWIQLTYLRVITSKLRQCTVHCLSQVRIKEEGCGRPVTANVKYCHILWIWIKN